VELFFKLQHFQCVKNFKFKAMHSRRLCHGRLCQEGAKGACARGGRHCAGGGIWRGENMEFCRTQMLRFAR